MDFSFLHTADLHLGSPFLGLSSTDEELARLVSSASREAFEELVTQAIARRVSFVVIAGDVYDGVGKARPSVISSTVRWRGSRQQESSFSNSAVRRRLGICSLPEGRGTSERRPWTEHRADGGVGPGEPVGLLPLQQGRQSWN